MTFKVREKPVARKTTKKRGVGVKKIEEWSKEKNEKNETGYTFSDGQQVQKRAQE